MIIEDGILNKARTVDSAFQYYYSTNSPIMEQHRRSFFRSNIGLTTEQIVEAISAILILQGLEEASLLQKSAVEQKLYLSGKYQDVGNNFLTYL